MTVHPEPGILIALADGDLSGPAAERARAHVRECPECRQHLGDVKVVDELVDRVAPRQEDGAEGLSASLERALDDVIRSHVGQSSVAAPGLRDPADLGVHRRGDPAAGGASAEDSRSAAEARAVAAPSARNEVSASGDAAHPERLSAAGRPSPFRAWRLVSGVAAAAAAGILLWVSFRPAESPLLSGRLVRDVAPGAVRANEDATLHVELAVGRASFLAVFEIDGSAIHRRYPDPNPAFGTFGRTTPFAPGEAIRIPPTALADFDAPPADRATAFVVVPSAESFTPSALAELERVVFASLREHGVAGLEAALAPRYPGSLLLR